MIYYAVRHWAHPDCIIARGEPMLRRLKPWQLGRLSALKLEEAGQLELVQELIQEGK